MQEGSAAGRAEELGDDPIVLQLAPDEHAPARARHRAVALTRAVLDDPRRSDLELLVSEIVSNAVLHGSGDVVVALRRVGGHVRVDVSDANPVLPRQQPMTGAHGGFGLRLLDQLAASWGIEPHLDGKTVWFCV